MTSDARALPCERSIDDRYAPVLGRHSAMILSGDDSASCSAIGPPAKGADDDRALNAETIEQADRLADLFVPIIFRQHFLFRK